MMSSQEHVHFSNTRKNGGYQNPPLIESCLFNPHVVFYHIVSNEV